MHAQCLPQQPKEDCWWGACKRRSVGQTDIHGMMANLRPLDRCGDNASAMQAEGGAALEASNGNGAAAPLEGGQPGPQAALQIAGPMRAKRRRRAEAEAQTRASASA